MPGLLRTGAAQLGNAAAAAAAAAARCSPLATSSGSTGSNEIWSKHRDCITFDQLQKFWSGLPPHARQELLKVDKQMLFEQARKNLYCSRCNGLLLEVFSQIVMYGKSLHQEGTGMNPPRKAGDTENQVDEESDDPQDPYVHPWGGFVATRDGILTLLDCYIYGQSLQVLQNVFDSARARERERELLYPDACGGGGRGWISQSMATYSRGHGTRETCALHTARLSCDTLVDFWTALGDETRLSLLSMKEEDFIERLMYRFDSKRFCRDCRRNVIREFKELKELKRMRREPRCTNWFCVADTAFQYEVSDDTVQADWHQYFTDSIGTYHHFEWAIGTGEGKSDILEFEDVGVNGEVQASGLDLGGLSACFITLRAWRLDGRCTELAVKAHALKGQPCVHRRLIVGDGFVTITKGENIRRFFEHAEEAEEEEDDDSLDKDGNEMDDDGFRPQKHAKSPELAREFLLDAATVIFKEQVEKAFREGTARQNAHSTFICLALKLLEERVLVACKEIITWEKQIKLLEEEEKEKREEEERKERRRMKEREKKLRRKERLKEKERERERKNTESNSLPALLSSRVTNESSTSTTDEQPSSLDCEDSLGIMGDVIPSRSDSSDTVDDCSTACVNSEISVKGVTPCILEQSKSSRQNSRLKNSLPEIASRPCDKHLSASGNEGVASHDESEKNFHPYVVASSRCMNGDHRQLRGNVLKTNNRNCGPKFNEKFHCFNSRVCDRYDFHRCSFNQHGDYRAKDGQSVSTIRSDREIKVVNRQETFDARKPFYQRGKYGHGSSMAENFIISKGKVGTGSIQRNRGDSRHMKQVWEPMDSQKKCCRIDSDLDNASTLPSKIETHEAGYRAENGFEAHGVLKEPESPDVPCPFRDSANSAKIEALDPYQSEEISSINAGRNKFDQGTTSGYYSKNDADKEVDLCHVTSALSMNNFHDPLTSSSSSENCSSYLSEGDSSTSSSSTLSTESSSTSDSEDASQLSEGREISTCTENAFEDSQYDSVDSKCKANGVYSSTTRNLAGFPMTNCTPANFAEGGTPKVVCSPDNGLAGYDMAPQQQHMLPMHPAFPPRTMDYSNQCRPVPWTALPGNRMVSFTQPNQYMFPCPPGYGLPMYPSSDFCMQYNALQPLASPVANVGQLSPCHFPDKANIVHLNQSNGQPRSIKSGGTRGSYTAEATGDVHPLVHPRSSGQLSPKIQSGGENGSAGSPAKSHADGPSFSLFHFGGPMAVAAGCRLDPAHSGAESNSSCPSNPHEGPTDRDSGGEESKIGEYSLFASGGNAIFSFLR